MEKLTEMVTIRMTPEMASILKVIVESEGTSICDLGRELFAQRIEQTKVKILASRKLYDYFQEFDQEGLRKQ